MKSHFLVSFPTSPCIHILFYLILFGSDVYQNGKALFYQARIRGAPASNRHDQFQLLSQSYELFNLGIPVSNKIRTHTPVNRQYHGMTLAPKAAKYKVWNGMEFEKKKKERNIITNSCHFPS